MDTETRATRLQDAIKRNLVDYPEAWFEAWERRFNPRLGCAPKDFDATIGHRRFLLAAVFMGEMDPGPEMWTYYPLPGQVPSE